MRRLIRFLIPILGALGTLQALAQAPNPISITGSLTQLTGSPAAYASLSIQLQNCAAPITIPNYFGIVQTQMELQADANGNINASIWPNSILDCNGTTGSSSYAVMPIVSGVPAWPQAVCYQVTATQGVWNINTQQPVTCVGGPPNPQDGQFQNLNVTNCFTVNGGSCIPVNGWLPLAGGTMTGPLIGTSSKFASGTLGTTIQLPSGSNAAGTLQTAITAAGANGTIIIPSGYAETPTAGLTISQSNVTLEILPGATITKGGNFDLLTITGTNDQLYGGGTLAGNGSTYTGNVVTLFGATKPIVHDLIITVPQNHGVYLAGVSGGALHHLNISGMVSGDGIFGENNTSGVDVHDNTVDRTAATSWGHAIGFHSSTTGEIVSNNHVHDNIIYNGASFCVEVGAFGGLISTGNSVDGNKCYQMTNPGGVGFGGYSIGSTASSFTLNDNLYINTFAAPQFAGIELVETDHATVKGNTIIGSNISVDSSSTNTIGGNTIKNQYSNCFSIQNSNYAGFNVKNNVIDHNVCDVSASTNTGKGAIYIQCNVTGIDCGENTIDRNTILQNGGASNTVGISLENDFSPGSTMANNTISGNKIENAVTGIQPDLTNAGTVLATFAGNQCISCTQLYSPTRINNWLHVQSDASPNVNEQTTSFTPTATGWYRVVTSGNGSGDGGRLLIDAPAGYANAPTDIDLEFVFATGAGVITSTRSNNYNSGVIDQVRIGQGFFDIHVSTITTVQPIALTLIGPTAELVYAPVVGAAAPSPVATLNLPCQGICTTGIVQSAGSNLTNQTSGTLSSGSGTTASHTFSTPFGSTPGCGATPTSNTGAYWISSLTSSAITVTYATSGAQSFFVQCTGGAGVW